MKKTLSSISFTVFATFFVFAAFLFFSNTNAQDLNTNLSISLSPTNPTPGEQITASLQSYSLDLNRSKITWLVNGVEKRTEIGLKNYTTQAGQAGILMTITARIETNIETAIEKEISFVPAGIDLLYEVVSYTPPFYKGKAMNSNQATVVISAFPEMYSLNGQKYNTQDLVYTWRKDGIVAGDASGKGKNYINYTGAVPVRDVTIEVSASSLDQTVTASKSITISRGSPQIIFYENSPIYGLMLNRAIKKDVKLLGDEFSAIALPYYFSAGFGTSPNLDFTWTMNGSTVPNQEPKNSFTVRQETEGAGSANIGLKISNSARIFQFADNDFIINFQK